MPLFDALGNTLNASSWELHKTISKNAGVLNGQFYPKAALIGYFLSSSPSIEYIYNWVVFYGDFLTHVWPYKT